MSQMFGMERRKNGDDGMCGFGPSHGVQVSATVQDAAYVIAHTLASTTMKGNIRDFVGVLFSTNYDGGSNNSFGCIITGGCCRWSCCRYSIIICTCSVRSGATWLNWFRSQTSLDICVGGG